MHSQMVVLNTNLPTRDRLNGLSSEENTFTFIRTNPDVDEKADIVITKQWNDQDNAADSRPGSVTVKLEYKKQVGGTWDVNWHDVKGTQGDYLFYDETAGADNTAYNAAATFTYVMNQSNDWQMELKTLGLPKTKLRRMQTAARELWLIIVIAS